MDRDGRLALTVGTFVLVALAALAVSILSLTTERGLFALEYRLRAHFENVQGLQVGAPVWLAGKNVGRIESIQFTVDDGGPPILATLAIDTEVQDFIRADSIASIGTIGVLGDSYVELSVGSTDAVMLVDVLHHTDEDVGLRAVDALQRRVRVRREEHGERLLPRRQILKHRPDQIRSASAIRLQGATGRTTVLRAQRNGQSNRILRRMYVSADRPLISRRPPMVASVVCDADTQFTRPVPRIYYLEVEFVRLVERLFINHSSPPRRGRRLRAFFRRNCWTWTNLISRTVLATARRREIRPMALLLRRVRRRVRRAMAKNLPLARTLSRKVIMSAYRRTASSAKLFNPLVPPQVAGSLTWPIVVGWRGR